MFVQNLRLRLNNLRIHNKIILLLATLITSTLIMSGLVSFSTASKIVNKQVNNNLKSSVEQIAYNLEIILRGMKSNIELVYQDRVTQKFLGGNNNYTRQQYNDIIMTKISPQNATATYLFSREEMIYGYNINYIDTDFNYRHTIEYRKCKANNDKITWITTNHLSIGSKLIPENDKDRLCIASIIKDFDSMDEVGFMVMTFKENDIFNVYNKIKMTDGAYGFIIDKEGYIVSHSNKSLLGSKYIHYPELNKKMDREETGSFLFTIDNTSNLVFYDTLQSTDWKFIYVIPTRDLLKDINLIRDTFLIVILICFIISISFAFLVSRSITKPIGNIVSVMSRFGKGDMTVRITNYGERTDEVGVLANEFNSVIEKINDLIKNNYHNEIKKKEAEMMALQAQINPHFLYNTLDCINFMARKYKVMEISRMVIALGDLMRISIRKDLNMITVKDEISYIQNYMTIQKIRYRDKLDLTVNVEESLNKVAIPKLILQPLVENAVAHGIEPKVGKGTVTLNGYRMEDKAVFEIIDDGIGFNDVRAREMLKNNLLQYDNINIEQETESEIGAGERKGTNIGLLNVDMRLKLIYGKEYGIALRSKTGVGTTITVKLPI
jgi:two-component system, sensor histidine kinase YesM